MTEEIASRDHAERVATFRHGVIGALAMRAIPPGDLAGELRGLSQMRFRVLDSEVTRTFAVSTLERWLYAYRAGGVEALRPRGRSDRGRGRDIPEALKELLCAIRQEHPSASVPLIIKTLEEDGRAQKSTLKASTVRKLFAERGLVRMAERDDHSPKTRLRWQAAAPDALWHGDVCHGPTLTLGGVRTPIRVHGMLDDCSRYVVALEAHTRETEEDMLGLLVRAIRIHGKPDALYLDNGSTYRGELLKVMCGRLGISLLHAGPYDPQARGKMERFWRTLRETCLDHLGAVTSLEDVNARLRAFLERFYRDKPHAGLMGKTPAEVYAPATRTPTRVTEDKLHDALMVRTRRRVRRDMTLSIEGRQYEVLQGYLSGRIVTIAYSLLDDPIAPFVEEEGRLHPLHLVDPIINGAIKRPPRRPEAETPKTPVVFDPSIVCRSSTVDRDAILADTPAGGGSDLTDNDLDDHDMEAYDDLF